MATPFDRRLRGIRTHLEREAGAHRYCSIDLGKGDSPPPPPPPPDPSQQISAQAKALPSIYSPFGSAVYSGDPNVTGSFRQDVTLSPTEMAKVNARDRIVMALAGRAESALPRMPIGYEFRGASDPTTNRFFTEQKKMLDKSFDQDEQRLIQRLANQGIPMGSEAYERELETFRQAKADATERAATNALTTGYQQDITTRQQNLNEISQALGGAQLQPFNLGGGSPIDTQGAFAMQQAGRNAAYQGQLNAYNSDVGQSNAGISAAATIAAAFL